MKLEKQITDVVKIGKTNAKQATISESKIGKLQYILTKGLYSDPITAVIAEIANNGVDSVVQSGKDPKENPVLVEIGKNAQGNYFFRVTDKGTGLIPWEFKNIVMNYLESTKENDDSSIGYFGLGSKSFLSLERTATFTCRRKGAEWKFLAYQGEEFCEYDMISKKPTTEEDGVTFEIPIKGWSEKAEFEEKAVQKLAYYDTVALVIDGKIQDNKIIRSEDWQHSSANENDSIHLCLKDVYYTIDYNKLGILPIDIPIALRFGLKDGLVVTPSRESLIYTEKVKRLILDKIGKVAQWFVNRYNKETSIEFDSIIEAWPQIDAHNKVVEINGVQFTINSLAQHSNIPLNEVKVKNVGLKPPIWYKQKKDLILSEYSTILNAMSGSFKNNKQLIRNTNIVTRVLSGDNVVLVADHPLGYPRQYLYHKYAGKACIVITRRIKKRVLRFKPKMGELIDDAQSYYHLLDLALESKKKWRARVKEFQRVEKEFKDKIIDETNVENSKDFKEWVVNHQAFLKANRGPTKSNYKGLNKQSDEMTISVAREGLIDKTSPVFEKKVFKIKDLTTQSNIFVLFKDKIEAALYWNVMRGCPTVKVCMIGSLEIKKLPLFKSKKFIKFEDFMTNDCKPFQRIASSILFSRVMSDFNKLQHSKRPIFHQFLESYLEDYDKLTGYVQNNLVSASTDVEIEDAILEVAKEKDLFDKQIWDVYLRIKQAVDRFDFLTCLQVPSVWDKEATRKYERLINQMLLFQKKYYDLEGYELVKKSEEPTTAKKKVVVEEEEDEFAEAF